MGGGRRGGEGKRVESPARDVGPDLQFERGGVRQLLAGMVVVDGAEHKQAGEGDGLGGGGLNVGVDVHGVSVRSRRSIATVVLGDGMDSGDLYRLRRKVVVVVVVVVAVFAGRGHADARIAPLVRFAAVVGLRHAVTRVVVGVFGHRRGGAAARLRRRVELEWCRPTKWCLPLGSNEGEPTGIILWAQVGKGAIAVIEETGTKMSNLKKNKQVISIWVWNTGTYSDMSSLIGGVITQIFLSQDTELGVSGKSEDHLVP